MRGTERLFIALCLTSAAALLSTSPALATDPSVQDVPVNIQVLPVASLSITGSNLLYLEIPPAGSTIPANGVNFTVTGNASATVTAQPDAFVSVPTVDYPGGEHMGRAVLAGNPIGYRLRLDFPAAGMVGSPAASAVLPGYQDGATTPPLTVSLTPSGGVRNGRIHLEASPQWTPSGDLPLPGVYVGSVTLTVTAF